MAFVDEHQRVGRQVIEQRRRRLARPAPGQIAGIVFDAGAIAHFQHHFQIEQGALLQPLRLDQLVLIAQLVQPLA